MLNAYLKIAESLQKCSAKAFRKSCEKTISAHVSVEVCLQYIVLDHTPSHVSAVVVCSISLVACTNVAVQLMH